MEWPALVAKLHQASRDGLAPESPEAQALAENWINGLVTDEQTARWLLTR
jgi:hypothetical protein